MFGQKPDKTIVNVGRLTAEYVAACEAQLNSSNTIMQILRDNVHRDSDNEDSEDEDQDPLVSEFKHRPKNRVILQVSPLIPSPF